MKLSQSKRGGRGGIDGEAAQVHTPAEDQLAEKVGIGGKYGGAQVHAVGKGIAFKFFHAGGEFYLPERGAT